MVSRLKTQNKFRILYGMNTKTRASIFCALVTTTMALPVTGGEIFKDEQEKISYAVGMTFADQLRRQGISVNPEWAARGFRDLLAGKGGLLTDEEAMQVFHEFRKNEVAKHREKVLALMRTNAAAGAAFLATNKNNPGVITLPDGLQYRVIKDGTGEPPKREDIVRLIYRGTLLDGREFDSSTRFSGNPVTFAVNGLIPGWTEALMMMKPGAKWELFIPPGLAYRDSGNGQLVGPEATIRLEVELLSVEKPLTRTPPAASDVIRVPSFEEMQKGAQIERIKAEVVEKMERDYMEEQQKAAKTNSLKKQTP
jgi:FKBP-type peptidyl-prolyl cis-trans isomerase